MFYPFRKMFYPFRKESDLLGSTLAEQQVRDTVNVNKQQFEPFCDLVDSAMNIREHVANNLDSFAQQENDVASQLNIQQRSIFDVINKWARDCVKNLYTKRQKKVEPLHIFLTGKGGCGKSHLIRTTYQPITKNCRLSW